jgi:thiol-disulfide isomerase/thioredoxin
MRKTKNYRKNKTSKKKFNKTIKNRQSRKTFAGNNKTLVGKIFANWCDYCQMIANDWKTMKSNLAKKGGSFEFAEIEQQNESTGIETINNTYLKNSPTKLSLQGGYPTLFKIKKGVLSYFNGNRNLEEMTKWYSQ